MNILQLYSSNSYGIYSKPFAKIHGLTTAVILGNFCSMAVKFNNDFFFLIDDIAEQSCVHKQTVSKILKYLKDQEFITETRKGIPSKVWYSVNEERLINFEKIKGEVVLDKPYEKAYGLEYESSYGYNISNNIKSNTDTDESVSNSTNVELNIDSSTALPAGDALLVNQRGLFNEEVSIQKKEKSNRLTQKEEEALDVIKEFFIEDDELHFNHRLPTKENNYKKTVLIKKVMRYLDYIQQGTFLEKVVLTGEQKKLNLYLLEKPRLLEDVKDICAMAVEYWKLHLTAGYKPDNKDFLIAMPLDQWFYNERTQFSWFVECLASKPRFSMAVDTDKVRDAIDPDFLKHFDKLYQHLWHDWEKEEWYQYYLGVQSIYGKYKQIFDWYDGVITKSGWVHYLSSPNMFAYSFYMFLRDYPHYDNLKILNTRGQLWRDWRRHAKEMWKIDVNPSQQFIDKCLDEDRIHEIERRRWEQQEEIKRRKKEEEMLEELL